MSDKKGKSVMCTCNALIEPGTRFWQGQCAPTLGLTGIDQIDILHWVKLDPFFGTAEESKAGFHCVMTHAKIYTFYSHQSNESMALLTK